MSCLIPLEYRKDNGMPPIHVLIKPASGNCNMRCAYCFYGDIVERRDVRSYGMMSLQTLENVVRKALAYADGECTIAFQGGEPTLAGLDFYRNLIEIQEKYNTNGVTIHNAIQTNGLVLDEEWVAFLTENNFLVGLSVDGNKTVHDSLRRDRSGNGTYVRIREAASLMDRYHTQYNILTVVTAQLACRIKKVYQQYKKNGWRYMQFIPCLDPLEEMRGQNTYSLTPGQYAGFLKILFDLYYNDVSRGEFISIRYFDNLVGMMRGYPPESCNMGGICSIQYVVEADGGMYPCDFYVTDAYRIGNLNADSMEEIDRNRGSIGFIEQSQVPHEQCGTCPWYKLCRGGCRRDRDTPQGIGLNYYCEAYKAFFPYAIDRLAKLAQGI